MTRPHERKEPMQSNPIQPCDRIIRAWLRTDNRSAASPRTPHRSSSAKGFTLIELLVVIAIIALVAAILFPVFAGVRAKGRATACASNLRQVGLALLQYSIDHDETYPLGWFSEEGFQGSDAALGYYKWMDAVYPYIRSEKLFDCPDLDGHDYKHYSKVSNDTGHYGSYGLNDTYYVPNDAQTSFESDSRVPVGMAAVVVPAATFLVLETDGDYEVAWSDKASANSEGKHEGKPALINDETGVRVVARHQGRSLTLFCDGHVKSLSIKNLLEPGRTDPQVLRNFTIEDD